MRFFLDENFPLAAKAFLEAKGHEVFRALDHHPQGASDAELFMYAQRQQAIFLTTDKDFFHTIPFIYPDRSVPIMVFALRQPNRDNILTRLAKLLDSLDFEDSQAIYLVKDHRVLKRY